MQTNDLINLKRDCAATLVPSGTKVNLSAGSKVMLTQSLGGTYTVVVNGSMARIEGQDADALGFTLPAASAAPAAVPSGPVDEKQVWDQMRTCYDPEIPVNIVDLGLIYDCHVSPLADGGNRVDVKMTLTAPGCGMGASIAADVQSKIRAVPGITDAHVELVWEPTWNQSMMTEAAKLQLGLM